jgi:hypothetical protein
VHLRIYSRDQEFSMAGSDNLREASSMKQQVRDLLQSAGFKLHKRSANHDLLYLLF